VNLVGTARDFVPATGGTAVIDELEWDDEGVTVGGTRFRVGFGSGARFNTGPDELPLMKVRPSVERYVDLIATLRPRRVVELGIFYGGSVAFLTLLSKPDRYVATDIRRSASPQFEAWLKSHKDVVRPYYGVDQSDVAALRTIMAEEFAGEPLDLVVDDASHLLGPTRTSFNTLFPLLRPGGVYVIEDWAGAHTFERNLAQDPAVADRIAIEVGKRPESAKQALLTRLVFEIVLAFAYTDLVADIDIHRHWMSVTRGLEQPDPEHFDIAECHLCLGQLVLGDEPAGLGFPEL
jgi:hypothetical protein